MNSTKYIFKALLLLIGVLGFGGVCPINNHNLNMVNFLRSQGLHALSERFLAEEIEVEQIARLPTRTWSRLAWPPSAGGWGFVLLLPTGRQHWWVVLFFHFCKWSCFTFLEVKWMQNNCHTFCRMAMCRSKWRMLLQLRVQCTPTRFYNFFSALLVKCSIYQKQCTSADSRHQPGCCCWRTRGSLGGLFSNVFLRVFDKFTYWTVLDS